MMTLRREYYLVPQLKSLDVNIQCLVADIIDNIFQRLDTVLAGFNLISTNNIKYDFLW